MSSQTNFQSAKSWQFSSFSKKMSQLQEFIVARPIESVLSIFFAVIIGNILWHAADWTIFNAVWSGGYQACSDAKDSGKLGACWAAINFWGRFILFGRYPIDEIWRPVLASLLIIGGLACCLLRFLWWRNLFILWAVLLVVFLWLMRGGLGLKEVDIDNWGGLPLTITVAVYSIIPALFLGVLLALGRTSKLPMIRSVCVSYIELVRAVPLVSVLFMASVMIPLFFPNGLVVNKLVRAIIGFTLFEAAYMAETVRAGLAAVPRGQHEAADALGLGFWLKTRKIILPQALRLVIPPLVNNVISTFKDTSLVLIIGLFDLLSTAKNASLDINWRPYYIEFYIFVALIYMAFCLFFSRYSQFIEGLLRSNKMAKDNPPKIGLKGSEGNG